MLSLLKAKVGQYLVPIVAVSFIALALMLWYTQSQYENALEEKAAVELSLLNTNKALELETEKLKNERAATLNLMNSLKVVNKRYSKILDQLKGAERDEDGDITPAAAIGILCQSGLAEPSACIESNSGTSINTGK